MFFKEHFRSQYTFSSDMYTHKQSQDVWIAHPSVRKRTKVQIKEEKIKYIKVIEKSTKKSKRF